MDRGATSLVLGGVNCRLPLYVVDLRTLGGGESPGSPPGFLNHGLGGERRGPCYSWPRLPLGLLWWGVWGASVVSSVQLE